MTRTEKFSTWTRSQFYTNQFATVGLIVDAMLFAVRLPLAVVVILVLDR